MFTCALLYGIQSVCRYQAHGFSTEQNDHKPIRTHTVHQPNGYSIVYTYMLHNHSVLQLEWCCSSYSALCEKGLIYLSIGDIDIDFVLPMMGLLFERVCVCVWASDYVPNMNMIENP